MSGAKTIPIALLAEGERMANICNACRYCEGFCATFPALERRLSFSEGDLSYLANLCHNCGACYYSCQYAPPHEFKLNFPQALAQIRVESYKKYAWPGFLAGLFERNGLAVSLVTAVCLAAFLLGMSAMIDPALMYAAHPDSQGAFYAVLSHRVMAWTFGAVSLFVALAWAVGFVRFWRDTGEDLRDFFTPAPFGQAMWDALTLKNLDGNGDGCTYPNATFSPMRRRYHHLTFYGFMLCFAATTVATLYHYVFGWEAPYALFSLPVLLGVAGGIGLLIGPAGLMWLKYRRDPALADPKQTGMDASFLVLLFLISLTGLLLLGLREGAAMSVLLAVHLGVVMALFVSLPYGKFVHAIYRLAALVRFHLERRRPVPAFGAD
jgi:citrate/tricarballylate utilization protein